MERIQFSEMTNRLRRNLMAASFLIIGIAGFNIEVGNATASGMELKNLTTEVVLVTLLTFLIYHAIAFMIRAFEEFRLWELKLASRDATSWSGGVGRLELADHLKQVGDVLEKLTTGDRQTSTDAGKTITDSDIKNIKNAAEAADIYERRLKNFPTVTRVRFWIWDIGVACAVSILGILFATAAMPPGLLSRWFLG